MFLVVILCIIILLILYEYYHVSWYEHDTDVCACIIAPHNVSLEWIEHHIQQGITVIMPQASFYKQKQLLPHVKSGMLRFTIPSTQHTKSRWCIKSASNEWLFSPNGSLQQELANIPLEYDGIQTKVISLYPSRPITNQLSLIHEATNGTEQDETIVDGTHPYPSTFVRLRYHSYPIQGTEIIVYKDFSKHYKRSILNLIIYNESSSYEREFYKVLSPYLQTIPFVKTYFITFREQSKPIMIEKDIMYVQGKENMIPGVLDKSIQALEYCVNQNIPFDYFVRSNISTFIHYERFPFIELVSNTTLHNTSTSVLRVYLPSSTYQVGVNHIGFRHSQGTNIILSREATLYLLEHKNKLDRTVIDDIAINLVVQEKYPIIPLRATQCTSTPDERTFTYRHKTDDRERDVKMMKRLIKIL